MSERLISRAKNLGISAEIYTIRLKEYQIAKERTYKTIKGEEVGYGIRVIYDNRLGFIYSNNLNDTILDNAIKLAKLSDKDNANTLPSPKPLQKITGLYDNEVEDSEEKSKELIKEIIELEEKINLTFTEVVTGVYEVSILSTEGIDVSEKRSIVSIFASGIFKENNIVSPEIYEYRFSHGFHIDINELKEELSEKASVFSKREKIDVKGYDITLTQKAINNLLSPLLSAAVSAENLYRKSTPFNLNEHINENLEIIDDPLEPKLPFSRSFDDEGMPSKQNRIIYNGEIKTFLNNTYWSIKTSLENTNSASRTLYGNLIPSYSVLPRISPSNLIIKYKRTESNVEDGTITVDQVQGVHTANYSSGEFSVVASVGWLNKSGERIGLREIVISGDIKNLLKNIVASSKEAKLYGNIVSGKLRVTGLSII